MSCKSAMVSPVITAFADQTVEEALQIFEDNGIRGFPVIDHENHVVGVFNFHLFLQSLLPMAVSLAESDLKRLKHINVSLDHLSGMAPWVVRRMGNVLPRKIGDIMVKEFKTVREDTPLGEGIRLLVEFGSPIPVVTGKDKELVGVITSQSIIRALQELKSEAKQQNQD